MILVPALAKERLFIVDKIEITGRNLVPNSFNLKYE